MTYHRRATTATGKLIHVSSDCAWQGYWAPQTGYGGYWKGSTFCGRDVYRIATAREVEEGNAFVMSTAPVDCSRCRAYIERLIAAATECLMGESV